MAKDENKKCVKKRIKITGTGKVMREQAYRSHLAQNKSTKQKRQSRKSALMSKSDLKRFKALI
ncbi:50S ribosomal protein L35 [Mycoplasmopsis felis]|nr:50S ribosomal protein L35 [Mycoplasmopsis felis]MCU9939920.1 50S ribosomal protein L35 [Mycoplasmopsis felis]UWV80147.1 50S ribosomal protein L35 [Mycoplasmopsis felis]